MNISCTNYQIPFPVLLPIIGVLAHFFIGIVVRFVTRVLWPKYYKQTLYSTPENRKDDIVTLLLTSLFTIGVLISLCK